GKDDGGEKGAGCGADALRVARPVHGIESEYSSSGIPGVPDRAPTSPENRPAVRGVMLSVRLVRRCTRGTPTIAAMSTAPMITVSSVLSVTAARRAPGLTPTTAHGHRVRTRGQSTRSRRSHVR